MAGASLCAQNNLRQQFRISRFWPEVAPVAIHLTTTCIDIEDWTFHVLSNPRITQHMSQIFVVSAQDSPVVMLHDFWTFGALAHELLVDALSSIRTTRRMPVLRRHVMLFSCYLAVDYKCLLDSGITMFAANCSCEVWLHAAVVMTTCIVGTAGWHLWLLRVSHSSRTAILYPQHTVHRASMRVSAESVLRTRCVLTKLAVEVYRKENRCTSCVIGNTTIVTERLRHERV